MVQCLRLHKCNAGCLGSIPGQQTKIPYAVQCGQNRKRGPQNYADHWQMPCCRSVEKSLKLSYGHGLPSCKLRLSIFNHFHSVRMLDLEGAYEVIWSKPLNFQRQVVKIRGIRDSLKSSRRLFSIADLEPVFFNSQHYCSLLAFTYICFLNC